jgi:hypothetical protein
MVRLSMGATWMKGANAAAQGGEKVDSRSLEWEGRYNSKANAALTFSVYLHAKRVLLGDL